MPTTDPREPGTHSPGIPCWFDVSSRDRAASRRFYAALFGWTWDDEGGPETGHYSIARKDGRSAAGLAQHRPDNPAPPMWNVYFATADADATARAVRELGGTVIVEPMDVMEQGRMVFFADPTGAHCGVWQPGLHKGAQIHGEIGAMTWCEVATRDSERARDFYAALFGLIPKRMEGMHYYTMHKGSPEATAECGVMQMTKEWEGIPPHWMPYFRVESTDAAAKLIEAEGGAVRVGPFDSPYGRLAVVADPSGAVFSVMGG